MKNDEENGRTVNLFAAPYRGHGGGGVNTVGDNVNQMYVFLCIAFSFFAPFGGFRMHKHVVLRRFLRGDCAFFLGGGPAVSGGSG